MRTRHTNKDHYTPSSKEVIAVEAIVFGIAVLVLALHLS
jgi:hypothetical protein